MKPNEIGDSFGMVTSLFTGLAVAGAYAAYQAQQGQMQKQNEDIQKQIELMTAANLIQILPSMIEKETKLIADVYFNRHLTMPKIEVSDESLEKRIERFTRQIPIEYDQIDKLNDELARVNRQLADTNTISRETDQLIHKRQTIEKQIQDRSKMTDVMVISLPMWQRLLTYQRALNKSIGSMLSPYQSNK